MISEDKDEAYIFFQKQIAQPLGISPLSLPTICFRGLFFPKAHHHPESIERSHLGPPSLRGGADVVMVGKNKIFLMPTRKRRIFARSGLKSVSSKNPPLTPSAQKRLFLLKRCDHASSSAPNRPVPSPPGGYDRPVPLRIPHAHSRAAAAPCPGPRLRL